MTKADKASICDCPLMSTETALRKPRLGSLQDKVLALVDHARCCDNAELSQWLGRGKHYVGGAAYSLWKKGLIAREQPGVWHTKTNI